MKPISNKSEAAHLLEACHRLIREGKPTKALETLQVIESFYQQYECIEEIAWCNFRQAQAEVVLGHTQAGLKKYVEAQHGFLEVDLPVEAASCMEKRGQQKHLPLV